ncbi:MAG: hypothetical protein JWM78_596 [Verrucomicrobiaceae bacterium]|nr:hypothetical protein [Verrucomicrobiaceae bacterium]
MNQRTIILTLLISASFVIGTGASAQNKDVDQADTLDFQSFHKDKKEALKVWDKDSTGTTKAYQDQPADNATAEKASQPASASTPSTLGDTKTISDPKANAQSKSLTGAIAGTSPSKRYEIRERYTLTQSTKTPYSAFYVIEPLYKQSAQLCNKGWKKIAERSEPIEQDFYLYYEIECL